MKRRKNMESIMTTARIAKAVETTKKTAPGHFEITLARRAEKSKLAMGPIFKNVDTVELEQALLSVCWEPYFSQMIRCGCEAFKANLSGKLNTVDLFSLPFDTIITLDDHENTGQVSAIIKDIQGEIVNLAILILGPTRGKEVVLDFYPGDPVWPSQFQIESDTHEKQVTVSEAIGMGFEIALIN